MLRRVLPTTPRGWGIATAYVFAILLMILAVAIVDWWSTATTLFSPQIEDGVTTAPITRDGQTLFSGYPWLAIALALIIPCGWWVSSRVRNARAVLGIAGVGLTVLATQLDSPAHGLVATNAWIPAAIAWFFYFGAQLAELSTRGPQLEFEARPDSSDG